MSVPDTLRPELCIKYLRYSSRIFYDSALDSISYSGVFLAAAVGASFFFPIIAPPLAITGVSIYFANITINLLQKISYAKIKYLNQKLFEFTDFLEKKCPYIPPILLISAFAASLFSLIASSILLITYSLITAVKIHIQKNMYHNNASKSVNLLAYAYPYVI